MIRLYPRLIIVLFCISSCTEDEPKLNADLIGIWQYTGGCAGSFGDCSQVTPEDTPQYLYFSVNEITGKINSYTYHKKRYTVTSVLIKETTVYYEIDIGEIYNLDASLRIYDGSISIDGGGIQSFFKKIK